MLNDSVDRLTCKTPESVFFFWWLSPSILFIFCQSHSLIFFEPCTLILVNMGCTEGSDFGRKLCDVNNSHRWSCNLNISSERLHKSKIIGARNWNGTNLLNCCFSSCQIVRYWHRRYRVLTCSVYFELKSRSIDDSIKNLFYGVLNTTLNKTGKLVNFTLKFLIC